MVPVRTIDVDIPHTGSNSQELLYSVFVLFSFLWVWRHSESSNRGVPKAIHDEVREISSKGQAWCFRDYWSFWRDQAEAGLDNPTFCGKLVKHPDEIHTAIYYPGMWNDVDFAAAVVISWLPQRYGFYGNTPSSQAVNPKI